MPARLLRLRYPAGCSACGTELEPKTRAWWDSGTKTARCERCDEARHEPGAEESAVPTVAPLDAANRAAESGSGIAGGSAQREFERRKARRNANIRLRYPRVGGLILALTDEPREIKSWARGAEGERKLGAGLDGLAEAGVVALHDRLRPGTQANIDHVAVTPSGVWVIDAKRYKGEVTKKDVGGCFSTDVRLYVGRRDCSKLVVAMSKQVAAVRLSLGADWADVPVRPMLCFVDAEWRWFAKPFKLKGVLVTCPKAARDLLVRSGPYPPPTVELIAARLDDRLEPALGRDGHTETCRPPR